MNYIWDYILRAEKAGYTEQDIQFIPAKIYSPYMELSFTDLNQTQAEEAELEVNPYYRYYSIFKELFLPDNHENEEIRMELFDILMHHLLRIDRYMGMNREEFYIRFLRQDMQAGCFGEETQEEFEAFSKEEQKVLLHRILLLYRIGASVQLFQTTFPLFFPACNIYRNTQEKEEILIYLGEKRSPQAEKKRQLLIRIFLPLSYTYRIYWEHHFGIIGVDESMHIENIELY